MPDALTTITKLIQSPPGQLAAGAVLAGIIWKFFERVESVLTDQTRLEIAVWLVGRTQISATFQSWPDTFATMFDRIFGTRHITIRCFVRSCIASVCAVLITYLGLSVAHPLVAYALALYLLDHWYVFIPTLTIGNCIPDYLSLLESRYALGRLVRASSKYGIFGLLLLDLMVTSAIALLALQVVYNLGLRLAVHGDWTAARAFFYESFMRYHQGLIWLCFIPAFFTSIWLWLYASSGFLLKAARRFDIGFEWFNRKFDIEKKPLQSIGLVAGALVAVVYWAAMIVSRVIG